MNARCAFQMDLNLSGDIQQVEDKLKGIKYDLEMGRSFLLKNYPGATDLVLCIDSYPTDKVSLTNVHISFKRPVSVDGNIIEATES